MINEYKEEVKAKLIQIYEDISCYGYMTAHKQLMEDGFSICKNAMQKYRKELGIKPNLSESNKEHAI